MRLTHQDDTILSYVQNLVDEIERVGYGTIEATQAIDRYTLVITAYMNGRIEQLSKQIKEAL
jgi:hypothetical protein